MIANSRIINFFVLYTAEMNNTKKEVWMTMEGVEFENG
jgi:hypothetical protein